MLLVISIFHFNPILTPFLNYGLNATQNLYMFAVDLGGLFFLHILDMATGKCFTNYHFAPEMSGHACPKYVRVRGFQTCACPKSWLYPCSCPSPCRKSQKILCPSLHRTRTHVRSRVRSSLVRALSGCTHTYIVIHCQFDSG